MMLLHLLVGRFRWLRGICKWFIIYETSIFDSRNFKIFLTEWQRQTKECIFYFILTEKKPTKSSQSTYSGKLNILCHQNIFRMFPAKEKTKSKVTEKMRENYPCVLCFFYYISLYVDVVEIHVGALCSTSLNCKRRRQTQKNAIWKVENKLSETQTANT